MLQRLLIAFAYIACLTFSPAMAQPAQNVAQSSEPYVFKVDDLDVGPTDIELDTPMALLEGFLDAGAQEDWARAAQAMDLANLTPAEQAQHGPEIARQLYEIVHRSLSLSWGALPDRPDAVDTLASNKDPMAGAARRSISLGRLALDNREVSVRINRLQQGDSEPVWLFSRQTVGNVPALYARYGPTKFEQSLPTALREQAFWTLAWWEVIAIPLLLIVAAIAAALTWIAIRNWRERVDDDSFVAGVLRAVHIPATLLTLAGVFALVRSVLFTFSGAVKDVLDPIQIVLVVAAALAIVLAFLEALLDWATARRTETLEAPENEDSRNFYTKMSAIRRIIIVVLILLGGGLVLIQSDLTNTLGFSLIASAGVIGLIIAFAARKVLADIMASLQIAFAKTARIGDAVYYDDQWCYVEKIGFTHLRLRTWDDRRVMAPVDQFVSSSFENWTNQDPSLTMLVHLELDHRADIDALREPFADFVANDDEVVDKDEAKIQVVGHSAQTMRVRFLARAKDPKSGWRMHCRLREAMLRAAVELDESAANEPGAVFIPREREVRMDLSAREETA